MCVSVCVCVCACVYVSPAAAAERASLPVAAGRPPRPRGLFKNQRPPEAGDDRSKIGPPITLFLDINATVPILLT